MRGQNRLGWMAAVALACSLAGCSGADVPSDAATGSESEALSSRPQTFCGGIAAIPCAEGQSCVDDPRDDCDPKHGGSDCGGICVEKSKPTVCGGFAGIHCPNGQTCVDDPSDDCNPQRGGSDCSGICIYARRTW